jgi:hypothetical protein
MGAAERNKLQSRVDLPRFRTNPYPTSAPSIHMLSRSPGAYVKHERDERLCDRNMFLSEISIICVDEDSP